MEEEDQGMPVEPVKAFCMVGGHGVDLIIGTTTEGVTLPEGWERVRLTHDRENDVWYEDHHAPGVCLVCPEHVGIMKRTEPCQLLHEKCQIRHVHPPHDWLMNQVHCPGIRPRR